MARSEALDQALNQVSNGDLAPAGSFLTDIVTGEATSFQNGWGIG